MEKEVNAQTIFMMHLNLVQERTGKDPMEVFEASN